MLDGIFERALVTYTSRRGDAFAELREQVAWVVPMVVDA